jgi:glycosyltransferase involved in cell wall biosynthesis
MNVLWLVNFPFNEASISFNKGNQFFGGWIEGAFNEFINETSFKLTICFPLEIEENLKVISKSNYTLIAFKKSPKKPWEIDKNYENIFKFIIQKYKPDLVHIWGTEYSHSLQFFEVFNNPARTIISIQGLVSFYEKHYLDGLSSSDLDIFSFRDFVKGESLFKQVKNFYKRGLNEIKLLKLANNVIGRTDWDLACVKQINSNIRYFKCNEIVRKLFYTSDWNINNIQRFSIFVSQSSYPIKGFHQILKALLILKKKYPKIILRTTGANILKKPFFKKTTYELVLSNFIKRHKLEKNIDFLGFLSDSSIIKEYLNAHLVVLPSAIENSSNSLSEAMILGVPIIASYVGGNKNFIVHFENGLLYPFNEFYTLSSLIETIFSDDTIANKLSQNAKKAKFNFFNPTENNEMLKSIYFSINSIYDL